MTQTVRAAVPAPLAPVEEKLHQMGYVVVPHGSDLCVRLPLLCSVRLRQEEDRIRLIPKFGPFSRSSGLLTTAGLSTAAVAGTALAVGLAPVTLIVAFAGLAALSVEACRFVVTEGCLTRLQNLIDRG